MKPTPMIRFGLQSAFAFCLRLLCLAFAASLFLLAAKGTTLAAQNLRTAPEALPHAPGKGLHASAPFASPLARPKGGLSGTVLDPQGALVQDAEVRLLSDATAAERIATTDDAGHFAFPSLPPAAYTVLVEAAGFQKLTSPQIPLHPGEAPAPLTLTLALEGGQEQTAAAVSRRELGGNEIHAAEQQRVLVPFPNFRTSFASTHCLSSVAP